MNRGFLKVYALKGGLREWVEAQFPTETKSSLEQACVRCHTNVTPRIVSDWQLSRHGQNEVNCSVCHGDHHMSEQDVAKAVVPTQDTCIMCHEIQGEQFKAGKHPAAWAAVKAMPTAPVEGRKGCGGCHSPHLFSVE